MSTERDRFFGKGHFKVRVVLDITSDGYDTQAPTEEEAKEAAHEQCFENIRFYLKNIATSDRIEIQNMYALEEDYDLWDEESAHIERQDELRDYALEDAHDRGEVA